MNCPWCGNNMILGYISASNRLCWTPEGEKNRGGTKWAKSHNSIILAEYYLLNTATVDAFYCERCKKIVIDTDE